LEAEFFVRRLQKVASFQPHVAILRLEPVTKGLSIVVMDHIFERQYLAFHLQLLRVPVISIRASIPSIPALLVKIPAMPHMF
jgi:hypothetical protein